MKACRSHGKFVQFVHESRFIFKRKFEVLLWYKFHMAVWTCTRVIFEGPLWYRFHMVVWTGARVIFEGLLVQVWYGSMNWYKSDIWGPSLVQVSYKVQSLLSKSFGARLHSLICLNFGGWTRQQIWADLTWLLGWPWLHFWLVCTCVSWIQLACFWNENSNGKFRNVRNVLSGWL